MSDPGFEHACSRVETDGVPLGRQRALNVIDQRSAFVGEIACCQRQRAPSRIT